MSPEMPDESVVHTVHSLWSAILTLLGGVGTMFIKNLRDDLKGKADKDDVDEKHSENIKRFDKLDETLERIDNALDRMGQTVAVLGDRAGLNNGRSK
jgi:hypothetical protein